MSEIRKFIIIIWVIITFLGIYSYSGKAQAGASFELTYVGQPGPLFNEVNLAPLDSITKQITVKNLTDSTQKFALHLENLLGTPDDKLASVLTAEISRSSSIIYSSKLSDLKDTETFLENIPAGIVYTYDIKVTMDDVGNEYQAQEVQFDLTFGWLEQAVSGISTKPTQGVLGTSTGPQAVAGGITLPETGANALVSVFTLFLLLSMVAIFNIIIGTGLFSYYLKKAGWQKISAR